MSRGISFYPCLFQLSQIGILVLSGVGNLKFWFPLLGDITSLNLSFVLDAVSYNLTIFELTLKKTFKKFITLAETIKIGRDV